MSAVVIPVHDVAAPPEAWVDIGPLGAIPPRGSRVVRSVRHGDVAVFRTADDRVFALLDRCPHKGGPLSQGIVFGDKVACPLHGWTIGLADGEAVAPDHGCAPRFEARVEGGRVMVKL